MDLKLVRFSNTAAGIFSYLRDETNNQVAVTCEHAYQLPDTSWQPKIVPGTYLCQRGTHQLAGGLPFETFEVTKVPNCWGILFHKGNFDNDSQGCILVGTNFGILESQQAILGSAAAFDRFMSLQQGLDQFWLTVQ